MRSEQATPRRAPPAARRGDPVSRKALTGTSAASGVASALNAAPRVQGLKAMQTVLSRRGGPAQRAASADGPATASTSQANQTGLPGGLKSGVEALSGLSMDHVRVHRNSPRPAQLQAHAFTQGSDIHVAPGQERHLPHEAWHVVQQAQGRVRPTMQMKGGIPLNDDAGLEREADVMGARAARGAQVAPEDEAVGRVPAQRAPMSTASVQRVLVVDNVPPHFRSGGTFKHRTFDNAGSFKLFIDDVLPAKKAYSDRFWSTPVMQEYLTLVERRPPPRTVDLSVIAESVREAVTDSERLDTLDPEGPVPEHHELATFAEDPSEELRGHSMGPVGYASKMMGKPGERDDFSGLLSGVGTVVLTTGAISDVALETGVKKGAWEPVAIPKPKGGGGRRPGLSIINYSNAIYRSGAKLAVCGVRGKILMDQFGLAIREFVHAKSGRTIKIQTIFNREAVQENYSRLLGFFKTHAAFQEAHTVVFGYASAFEDPKFAGEYTLVRKTEDHGWVGYLFDRKGAGLFAVFDSDLTHSYHGEILAENVKLLLEDRAGRNVSKVLIGGSAGSLVAPRGGEEGGLSPEESLTPNGLYIPEAILRPDGFFKRNALHSLEVPHTRDLATLPGSMHTSVVSVLAETPGVLNDLVKFGVKTVDMEFGYVALVLGDSKAIPKDRRDLAEVKIGVACLVTDFPKTGAHDVALAEKNEMAKRATKALFVQTVIASMR